ncbi:MAG: DegT/DnrJ/EryC1/StrS aminotransferase family protein [Thermoanaerobaculia bacterium]|nr:DegT/DnrJ/EryC1/StrS aminotransferase family protein [Thermoanaerobaculia bacterium]
MKVPYFRPSLSENEIEAVTAVLRSGWLTSGPRAAEFEAAFSLAVGGRHALAVSSATAAMHLAVEALGLEPNQAVLVPTMTFAATAEVVRYMGGIPILVDCEPDTGNMDLQDALRKLKLANEGELPRKWPDTAGNRRTALKVVGIIPVHVGGLMMDTAAIRRFADDNDLWVVEDAAHAFPSAWRANGESDWKQCGQDTADVTCFSFYANKTITTGEGGMAVTASPAIEERMRCMALHGLSRDAWGRYSGGSWDYRIVAPGYKYNLTDIQAALGVEQLARAEAMRLARERQAERYYAELKGLPLSLPTRPGPDRRHSWHLFPIKLNLEDLSIDRDEFLDRLREGGVGFSVHWRPLHLHPYYQEVFGWDPDDLPIATREWVRLVSLPIFPSMSEAEQGHVVHVLREVLLGTAPR